MYGRTEPPVSEIEWSVVALPSAGAHGSWGIIGTVGVDRVAAGKVAATLPGEQTAFDVALEVQSRLYDYQWH